jgi:DNA-binding NarL/FixJ family response regulator
MIRIVLFDDNKALARGLALVLEADPDLFLVNTFTDATEVIKKVGSTNPDVILMDIQMPGISGIEAVSLIRTSFPQIQILMQTVFEEDDKVFAALCAGASGYILKGTPLEDVLAAVKQVYQGATPMSPSIARKVLAAFQNKYKEQSFLDYEELTVREKEVLNHLAKGLSYKMIADCCGISTGTVNSHLKKIYEKLHVNSATEAIAKARDRRIVK